MNAGTYGLRATAAVYRRPAAVWRERAGAPVMRW